MSLPQALLLAALLAATAALLRAIRTTLRELEPRAFAHPLPLPLLHTLVVLVAHYAARRLKVPWRAAQRSRLLAAGLADRPTPPEWFALRCLAVALAVAALSVVAWLGGASLLWKAAGPALLAGFIGPELWLRHRIRHRMRAIDAELPLHLEMLLTGLEAGLDWRASLRCAGQCGHAGHVRQEMARCVAETPAYGDAGEALWRLQQRLHSPAARRLLAEVRRVHAGGAGLRSALYGVLLREEARGPSGSVPWGPWSVWQLARPLLAGGLPGIALIVMMLRPP